MMEKTFIGIKDDCDTEIYSGDIVQFEEYRGGIWHTLEDEVIYQPEFTSFMFKTFSMQSIGYLELTNQIRNLKVIGNIWQKVQK